MDVPKREEIVRASDTWEALLRAYVTINRDFQKDELWSQVSMREYDVLYTLAKAEEPLSQSELLEAVLLSQPAVSRMLKRMETKGWLYRKPCVTDARTVEFGLTSVGKSIQRQVGRHHGRQIHERLSTKLSPQELETLQELLIKMKGTDGE